MKNVPLPGSPALRQGLIYGVILAIVAVVFGFLQSFVGLGLLGSIISLAIYFIFGLLAGQRASTQTGKIGTGILAGFLAGLVSSIISAVISIILTVTNLDNVTRAFQQASDQQGFHVHYTPQLALQSVILVLALGAVLSSLISLAGGSIGGYLGKGRARVPLPPQYEESMFKPPSPLPPPEQNS